VVKKLKPPVFSMVQTLRKGFTGGIVCTICWRTASFVASGFGDTKDSPASCATLAMFKIFLDFFMAITYILLIFN
jgi:hypothetical protein